MSSRSRFLSFLLAPGLSLLTLGLLFQSIGPASAAPLAGSNHAPALGAPQSPLTTTLTFTFTPSGQTLGSADSQGLAMGDFDGDSDLDALVAVGTNTLNAEDRVWINDGQGNFTDSGQRLGGLADGSDIAVGDLDNDGDLDGVVANVNGASFAYINDGAGQFTVGFGFDASSNGSNRGVALGDVDGDADFDVILAGETTTEIWRNDGAASFTQLAQAPLLATGLKAALGRMDGDGDLDLVVVNNVEFVVYANNGAGSFTEISSAFCNDVCTNLALGRLDADADLDVFVTEGDFSTNGLNRVFFNNGAGVVSDSGQVLGPGPRLNSAVSLGDVNDDGFIDAFVAEDSAPGVMSRFWLNDGTGIFVPTAGYPVPALANVQASDVALVDVNGDQDLDVFVVARGQPSTVFYNTGSTILANSGQTLASSPDATVALGDVDGDGDLDAFIGRGQCNGGADAARRAGCSIFGLSEQPSQVWRNNGAGTFTNSGQSLGNTVGVDVALGDFNGDGDLDAWVANRNGSNQIFTNNGSGTYAAGAAPDTQTNSIALGDLDGDGDLDAWLGRGSRDDASFDLPDHVWLNNGAGVFTDSGQSLGEDATIAVVVGDVDGDGDLDAVQINNDDAGPRELSRVWFNDGEGNFTDTNQGLFISNPQDAALGDVDGDGDLDLYVANGYYGLPNLVFLNDGAGHFTDSNQGLGLGTSLRVTLGDIDRDGDLDALVTDLGGLMLNLNDGTGHFTVLPVSAGDFDGGALGDLNADGNLDAFVLNFTASGDSVPASVWLNTLGRNAGFRFSLRHPGPTAAADDYASPVILNQLTLPITYTLVHSQNLGVGGVQGFYSLNGGGQWFPAVRAASGTLTGNNNTPTPIPDVSTITSTINLNSSLNIADVDVWLNINHTYVGDLVISLQSPTGQTAVLSQNRGGSGQNFVGTTFDDEATALISAGAAPFTGRFIPDGSLATFDNRQPTGLWRLIVSDTASQDIGVLTSWGLTVTLQGGSSQVFTGTQTYNWDVANSGFFGVSDNVAFRLEAYPRVRPFANGQPGPYQWPVIATQSYPFRVRGTQVRVMNGASPAENAIVYRLPTGQTTNALALGNLTGAFLTDNLGYLRGRGQVNPGDGLVALAPLNSTLVTTLFSSTDVPTPIPVGAAEVTSLLTIPAGGTIEDLDIVNLTGTHDWISDLSFSLRSPNGTEVLFMANSCSDEDNFNINFDDEAASPYWPCPPTDGGTYLPSNALSAFDGENSTGTWTLIVRDNYPDADGGSLASWGLAITSHTGGAGVYLTNAAPTATGLSMTPASAGGVQTLTVSTANPLILFDLTVALEWDARNDTEYLAKLQTDLQRTSEFLYDWTNGRVALGKITVYQNRDHWNDAQVRIYGTNGLHPNADQGGVTTVVVTETVVSNLGISRTLTYSPGQVRMAAVWSRFGGGASLGEDWPRTLAHELGHYLLYLDDAYLGMDTSNNFIPLSSCAGTAMTDPYRDDYSEFIFDTAYWNSPACNQSLAARTTNRTEWATLRNFYPTLPVPITNTGPSLLPLAVTQINIVEPALPPQTLPVPIFYLTYNNNRATPHPEARAILFQLNDSRLIDLGHPVDDRVTAYGAQPGDRLCVYDLTLRLAGCELIAEGDASLKLVDRSTWQPDIVVSPVTSRTVNVQVSAIASGLSLQMQVYPQNDAVSPAATFTESGGVYSVTVTLNNPTTAAYVHIWVEEAEPRRESFSDYSLGGNPAPPKRKAPKRAPVTSNSGEVTLYNDLQLDDFAPGEFFALQPATRLNNVPGWLTVVGKGYRLLKSSGAPSLAGTALGFSYDLGDVPAGEEAFLQIYRYDTTLAEWFPLSTTVSSEGKFALATVPGAGLYALMSSTNIPLYGPGWNLFAYPVQATRPVTEALLSISGYYTTVYGYVFSDTVDPWRIYDISLPPQLNDLEVLEFGQGYWINVAEDLILRLKGSGVTVAAPEDLESFGSPPATFYGPVLGDGNFTPTPGMPVVAYINGTACGQGVTQMVGGQLMYLVKTWAEGPGTNNGCGVPGRLVNFTVNGEVMFQSALWDNSQVRMLPLAPGELRILYLPVVRR